MRIPAKKRVMCIVSVHLCVISLLLVNGCSSLPPLHSAASRHDLAKAAKLIQEGKTDINQIQPNGETALHCAAQQGDLEMVQLLHRAGADVNRPCAFGWTPLIQACHYGHDDVAKWLVDQGCDVDSVTNKGATALYMACCFKYDRIAEMLLPRCKHLVNLPTNDGVSPLFAACANTLDSIPYYKQHPKEKITREEFLQRQAAIVKVLLEAGANVNFQADSGMTPVHCITEASDTLDVLDALMAHGGSLTLRKNDGCLPLHYAVKQGNVGAFEYFVEKKAEIQPMEASNEITGRMYHLYADYLGKGSRPEQGRSYYTMAIEEYEQEIKKDKAMADAIGKKIFELQAKKFMADLAMHLLAAAASSYSSTHTYYYVPGQLNLTSLQERKANYEKAVVRCENWMKTCKEKTL